MTEEERKYWIAFSSFPFIGPKRFSLLVKYFGTAKSAWERGEKDLLEVGLPEKIAANFANYKRSFSISGYLEKLNDKGVKVLISEDLEYPKLLKEIGDPPFVLYVKSERQDKTDGILSGFSDLAIAVVGTRKVTSYGREVTEQLVSQLVFNGITIVSGMARGVDGIAHKTAIDNGGFTVAVLGSGIDLVYPPEHRDLYNSIISHGAVISEFPMGFPPMPRNFPIRDRIMAGLSLGVLVTEAAEDSGSLITASFAGDYGREVFAVPGPITSPVSKGTSGLLKKGCKLVSGVSDILEELDVEKRKANISAAKILPSDDNEKLIIDILEAEQLHINIIAKKANLAIEIIGSLLMMMEMKGMVRSYGSGVYGKKN